MYVAAYVYYIGSGSSRGLGKHSREAPWAENFWIFFKNGAFCCTLYFWATVGPSNVAWPGAVASEKLHNTRWKLHIKRSLGYYTASAVSSHICITVLVGKQESPAVAREEDALQPIYSSCCSTDLQGHPRSMISISSERAYAIFCWWFIVTLTFS